MTAVVSTVGLRTDRRVLRIYNYHSIYFRGGIPPVIVVPCACDYLIFLPANIELRAHRQNSTTVQAIFSVTEPDFFVDCSR
jgi:hypothetical protein